MMILIKIVNEQLTSSGVEKDFILSEIDKSLASNITSAHGLHEIEINVI